MAIKKITVPDFGDIESIVVDIYVSSGDRVEQEDALIALESEKAVMDIPSPHAGVIKELHVKENDQVKSGDLIAEIEVEEEEKDEEPKEPEQVPEAKEKEKKEKPPKKPEEKKPQPEEAEKEAEEEPEAETKEKKTEEKEAEESQPVARQEPGGVFHATPSVRAYARELGVELSRVEGSGPKGRILREDVQSLVKKTMQAGAGAEQFALPEIPREDFSKYGRVEEQPLSRIKQVSGPRLQKSWVSVPHVTHFDEADASDLEDFRKQLNEEGEEGGVHFSPLSLIVKAVVATLREFPLFNCSLAADGKSVILKHYYHIGIAVDTPQGLVVPVIREADVKGVTEISRDLKRLSTAAREGKLNPADMQGGSFTISSLGGIGGTGFAPIVNAPQVAILGLSRYYQKPVWDGEKFVPRLTLPFSLSYDHRVIDGAEAARFCRALARDIEDLRRTML
ncbi:MAG: 2-oxo acid dehydrogenase subunit E2 [Syntrophotaleaceae bacterium]